MNKRNTNFSEDEINLLIKLVGKYKNTIECKKSDAVTWKEKEKGWVLLTEEFNLSTDLGSRTSANLKNKWENLKKNSRKKFAVEKQSLYQTGGGPPLATSITTVDDEVKEIIGISCTGLSNDLDSDRFEVLICDDTEQTAGPNTFSSTSWTHWTPAKLKRPISKELIIQQKEGDQEQREAHPEQRGQATSALALQLNLEQLESRTDKENLAPTSTKAIGTKARIVKTPRKTKHEVTQDCRENINSLSKVRIELAQTQKEYYLQEINNNKEQHELKLQQMIESHELEMEKKRVELEILKRNMNNY